MNAEEIRTRILDNLRVAFPGIDAEVRVQPDPYHGWRIAVITNAFDRVLHDERIRIALAGLTDVQIECLDLLTTDERSWAGALPIDSKLDDLPLWAESFARTRSERMAAPLFASDLETDLPLPIIATFYSLRGGVGRSTALAYTARALAHQGRKVLCIDMDLEAPGLAALFGCEDRVLPNHGVLQSLVELDQGATPDYISHIVRIEEDTELYLIPAGIANADYARQLRLIDPSAWYREDRNPLRLFIDGLSCDLPFRPDVMLIDARTGISPLSAPLVFDLADLAIIVFFPHPQALVGTSALVQGLMHAQTRRVDGLRRLTPEPRFVVSPLPASQTPEVVKNYEHRAADWITQWLTPANNLRESADVLTPTDWSHSIRYREAIATSDQILSDDESLRPYMPIADWITGLLPGAYDTVYAATLAPHKKSILDSLRFAPGTAEQQEHLHDTIVQTITVRSALDPDVPLIIGRKGTGKTAIFRLLSEVDTHDAIIVQAPAPLRGARTWMLGVDGFKAVADVIANHPDADWRHLWTFYVCVAASNALGGLSRTAVPSSLADLMPALPRTEMDLIRVFETIAASSRFGLALTEWLTNLDSALTERRLLLFDGLDTGFGNTEPDRQRRTQAIEGLFSLWTDRGQTLSHLSFKILLREDVWRRLRFENKSHLFGRSINLKWNDPADYFKVVLKQALRSSAFLAFLERIDEVRSLISTGVDQWDSGAVFRVWSLLVGERMKGGKTAFTKNWTWNRLADGNGDHTPRYLLQLFNKAVSWECDAHQRAPYERSLFRPRALIECLPLVADEAIGALREEFSELQPLLTRLQEIGRTPFAADELSTVDAGVVSLAREVGLLTIYEGSEQTVERYKVPDIYRQALLMTRRGQA